MMLANTLWTNSQKCLHAVPAPKYCRSMDSSRSDELDRFKRIDLVAYAGTRGFVVDRRASSRNSIVMRHANGDKIGVGKTPAGTFVYYNFKGDDSGTIIDLVQTLDGGSLGDVRKVLRDFDGSVAMHAPSPTLPFKLQPSQHDASRVLAGWMKSKPIGAKGHPYLNEFRGISVDVQHDPIFKGRIHIDSRGNAVFPHYNQSGLCGYELKNGNASGTTFTGFSPGGVKGLACSRPRPDDREMIVCETAIDMLSVATLEGAHGKRFFSTAGQISPMQAVCLRSAADKMPRSDSRIVLALDHDQGGQMIAAQIREALGSMSLPIVEHYPPSKGSDWNDVLLSRRKCDGTTLQLG